MPDSEMGVGFKQVGYMCMYTRETSVVRWWTFRESVCPNRWSQAAASAQNTALTSFNCEVHTLSGISVSSYIIQLLLKDLFIDRLPDDKSEGSLCSWCLWAGFIVGQLLCRDQYPDDWGLGQWVVGWMMNVCLVHTWHSVGTVYYVNLHGLRSQVSRFDTYTPPQTVYPHNHTWQWHVVTTHT